MQHIYLLYIIKQNNIKIIIFNGELNNNIIEYIFQQYVIMNKCNINKF